MIKEKYKKEHALEPKMKLFSIILVAILLSACSLQGPSNGKPQNSKGAVPTTVQVIAESGQPQDSPKPRELGAEDEDIKQTACESAARNDNCSLLKELDMITEQECCDKYQRCC